jgi:hypothetical protein
MARVSAAQREAERIRTLDRMCESRVRRHYASIVDDYRDITDDDGLSASMAGDRVYLDHTDWPAAKCSDRALDIAFNVMNELRYKAIFPNA